MRTDSAEVMHPLVYTMSKLDKGMKREMKDRPTGQTIVQADLGLGEFLGRCMCLIVSSDFKIGSCRVNEYLSLEKTISKVM